MSKGPQRIVCLSTETCETLYLLGEQARIVGISGFTVRPPQARKEKPKVSGLTSVKHEQILALEPDLVLGYSNLQGDMLAELASFKRAKQRIIEDPQEVVRRAPELIIGSWCGRRFRPEQVAARPGWQAIPAVRTGQLHEIKSPDILNPGPAVLTDGVRQLHALISACAQRAE